ncbi:MAG TPA: helix-turn-helix transcriptional regulator [Ferrovibrio sp.]|uniref:helix-turn-helix transcriptional regulator n=1 Tax=Ferrovibrio sp. TaxID=1917215 RepID=UPI002ED389F5
MPHAAIVESRRDLSAFLRSRRARLSPLDVGLPAGPRRRTPGLRREEVAQLAGVGVTWYTWFEQGRDIRVSAHFLENLARALRFDAAERAHLFALAQHRPPPLSGAAGAVEVSPALQRMIDAHPYPVYVKTARWDVVAWNRPATLIMGDFASVPPALRNVIRLVFTCPDYRRLMVDWAGDARRILARFRINYGRAAGDPAFAQLVDELAEVSPEFYQWWPQQDLLGQIEGVKTLRHPQHGEIEFEHTAFQVDAGPDLRLTAYMPLAGRSAGRMKRVIADNKPLRLQL